ncbi:MAG: DUF1003 domain-containing protein [Telluria sp.]
MATDPKAELPEAVTENIETIAQFYERHEQRKSRSQALIERFSHRVGSPGYVAGSLLFIAGWIAYNLLAEGLGWPVIDEPPFFWLQGLVALNAFLISTTVLIRQNNAALLAERHAHLDLQVNLLTERKTSKIIDLLEGLRRDLPNVNSRPDPEAAELAKSADAEVVLSAIEQETQDASHHRNK